MIIIVVLYSDLTDDKSAPIDFIIGLQTEELLYIMKTLGGFCRSTHHKT